MVKHQLKQLIILLLILTSTFLWIINSLLVDKASRQNADYQSLKAATISRINLLVINSQISERQNLGWLLQQLDNEPEISYWQLFNTQNKILSEKSIGEPEGFSQNLYIHGDKDKSGLFTLKLYFKPTDFQSPFWSFEFILLIGLFVSSIVMTVYLLFRWVFQVESFAAYLLSDSNNLSKAKFEKISNPISRVINQLILKNSLLNKDKVELTEQIRKISYVDEVTGLGNQLFFKAEFQVRLHNHEEDESGLFMIISFHESDLPESIVLTDSMLKAIANLLKGFSKTILNSLVARLRDNDFALLLPNQSRDNTDKICKTLISQLDKSLFDTTPIKDRFVDIGISAYKQGFDYYKVVAEADMALRNSQLQGGNNWYMYGEPLADSQVRGHLRWRNFLSVVLEKRQLQLFGQQIHFFNDNEIIYQEVLARIEDGKEVIAADTFLPMAHDCGLATEFDRQVVDGVIKHCLFNESSISSHYYSINLFISSLLDESFVSWLITKLSSYPKLSQHIIFEIKESHINQYLINLRKVMSNVVELGASWCVEHFGAPDEDLSFLDILPIKSVKIDRRVIFDIDKNKEQQLLLKSLMINLQSKKIQVFAEGVEKSGDAEYLKKSRIDAAQGFFFSQPKRMKNIEKHLKAV
ncbi:EAL domain-containing protein [Aliikangiella sp. IMCC44359]|uniref:EAL domain-containing protein n=1 Tax=Aliikangiella sp. IMCC44359 TaxID=3459125 RepID=UPI00403A954D